MMLPQDMRERCTLVSERWDDFMAAIESQFDDPPVFEDELEALVEYAIEQLPERDDFSDHLADQFVNSRTLGDAPCMARVLDAYPHDDVVRSILGEWAQKPAFYAAFVITAQIGDSLYEIEELTHGRRHTLYSPGLKKLQNRRESRAATYIALLVDNGLCLQTASILYYNHLDSDDIDFIGHVVDEPLYKKAGFDGVLKEYPKLFIPLFQLSLIPDITFRGVDMVGQFAALAPVSYCFEEPYWRMVESGEARQYLLDEASEEMVQTWGEQLFFEVPGAFNIRIFDLAGKWYLLTHSKESFATIAAMMGSPALRAEYSPSVALLLSLEQHGYPMPWAPFILTDGSNEHVEEEETGAGSEQFDRMNAFMAEYVGNRNEGRSTDVKQLARRHGMTLSEAEQIVAQMDTVLARYLWVVPPEEEEYQMSGQWPVPSPVMLRNFGDSLSDSQLFFILEEPEAIDRFNAHTQGVWRDRVAQWGLADVIEELFLDLYDWDDSGYSMLNLLLWIVLHKKGDPVLVRSIVVEAFKLFPYLSQGYDFEPFVERFSAAVIKAGVSTSLLRVKERPRGEARRRGLYTVQASELLSYLITAIPHSV